MTDQTTNYKQGHSASTISNHAIRTVETDAAFVLPHIRSDDRILDIGCGPGSITVGLARCVSGGSGSVVGVDLSDSVLELARGRAAADPDLRDGQVSFVRADVLSPTGLPFADEEFDIVFASQLFPHLRGDDMITAMREMRRVLKPGGFLATRDAAEVHWYPSRLGLDAKMTGRMLRGLDLESWPGGGMPSALRRAGFDVSVADGYGAAVDGEKVRIGLGTTVHYGSQARGRLADGFLGRLEEGDEFCRAWKEAGMGGEEIEEARRALREWRGTEDAWYMGVHTEILAWK